MNISFYSIFKMFFKVGTMLLGGGYVILPLLQSELVEKKQWITSDELCEFYALAQSVPGVIAANVSIFTGFKLKGQSGAIAALSGIITPAFIAIILLASIFEKISHLGFMKNIFCGVGIGVIILLYLATKELWNKSVIDKFTCGIFLGAFILSSCFHVSPAIILILAVASGIIYKKKHPSILSDSTDNYEECER